ncbi:sulfotransferase [Verrucomicrobiota bacterium]
MRKPDFFMVGAPKCGTTALHDYLSQHPGIFMAPRRGTNHFATDLLKPGDFWRSGERYLRIFRGAGAAGLVGESSVYYLFSTEAAANIRSFAPEAKIVAMIRNPVEVVESFHAQLVYDGDESITELREALAAETERRAGRGIPEHIRMERRLCYREVAAFASQVERYLDVFGKQAVHVVVYDDFKADTAAAYRAVLVFLGADETFTPDLRVLNPNKGVRSRAFHALASRPPALLRRPAKALLPVVGRVAGRRLLQAFNRKLNTTFVPRAPMPADLRRELCREFAPEVERLGRLLSRDLSHWVRTGDPAAA